MEGSSLIFFCTETGKFYINPIFNIYISTGSEPEGQLSRVF